jgi:endonuclease/exonuclease/phosphatase family metal-dependent hydrolase
VVCALAVEGEQEGVGEDDAKIIGMKLISLNTWGGRAGKDELLSFFSKNKDVDIFCLQEVWEGGDEDVLNWGKGIDTKMITNIGNVLKEHSVFFRPHYHDFYGLAIFARKNLPIREEGEIFVFKERKNITDDFAPNHARNIQYLTIEIPRGIQTIINFHGIWNGGGKFDSEERLLQSDNILRFVKNLTNPYILCGDFNLRPDTVSLKKLEQAGMRNLIKDFGITSTRSSHYKKEERFADYTLVSNGIKVNNFKVLPDEISDHLAMYLDFE